MITPLRDRDELDVRIIPRSAEHVPADPAEAVDPT
jgi:hypothetical protein